MRFKLTLLLLVANIVTFGLIWRNAGGNAETEISAQAFFSADISEIAVSGANGAAAYALERRGRDWFMTQPFAWRADAFAVSRLLNELRFLDSSIGFSVEEAADAGSSLASYGLEETSAKVSVTDSAGTHELRLGKTTPDGRCVYVLSPDGKVIVPAPRSLFNAVAQTPDDLRSREVFSMRPYEIRAVTVRTAFSGGREQRTGLVRVRGNGESPDAAQWRFETPVAAAADSRLVEKRLGELASLGYVRIVSGDAGDSDAYGLKTPGMRFTLDAADRSRTLLVGNADPSDASGETRFAKLENNPAVFTVPAAPVEAWRDAAREMRDPYFLRFDPAELIGITIHDGNDALVIHRMNVARGKAGEAAEDASAPAVAADPDVGAVAEPRPEIFSEKSAAAANPVYNSWQMPVAPGSSVTAATKVEPEVIAELIEKLRNLRAVRAPGADDPALSAARRRLCDAFVADVATPEDISQMKFNTPLRIVELEFASPDGKTRSQTLTIAPAAEEGTPIHAKTGTSIYSITPEILEDLDAHAAHFRDRLVFTLPEGGKIVGLKLSELDGHLEKTLLREACPEGVADWAEELEKNAEPFPQALAKLIRATSTVVAVSYLPEPFSRSFEDDAYLGMGVPEPWRYRVDVDVLLADGEKNTPGKTETVTYFLTRRLGGTTQLAGSPAQDCIFRIRQDFIDAMHALTFNRSGIIPEISDPDGISADNIRPAE